MDQLQLVGDLFYVILRRFGRRHPWVQCVLYQAALVSEQLRCGIVAGELMCTSY